MNLPFFKKKKTREQVEVETGEVKAEDIIAPSLIEVKQNYLKMGERICKTFFVFSYPRYLSTGWLSPVINLDAPLDVSLHIHPADAGTILRKLRKKVTEVQAEIAEREEKGLVRDPALETAYQDIEQLRDELQTARERIFSLGLYITIYGDDDKELREVETVLRSILESRLIYLKPALMKEKQGFISTCPYGLDQLMIHTPMNTGPLSSIFPFVSPDLSANEGILYGINQHNNSLVLFDRFTLENSNMVVFAKSGAGKSLRGDTPVLVRDKKGHVKLRKIGHLIEETIQQQGIDFHDEELEGKTFPGLKVWTFDKNMKGKWGEVKIAARKLAPKVFYKFKTRSGREITTTGDHNLVALKNGKIELLRGDEAKAGEYIPLPRNISVNENPPNYFNLLVLLKNSKDVHVIGAQKLIKENYRILKEKGISNINNEYLCHYKRGVGIPIKLFWQMLDCLSMSPNDNKLRCLRIVPRNRRGEGIKIHFPLNKEFLRIAGYITAEGYIPTHGYISIANTSKEILNSIKSSLRRLGLFFCELERQRKGQKKLTTIVIQSIIFSKIIKELKGGGRAGQKKVWPLIFTLSKEQIAHYLLAYYEGDGGVDIKNKAVVASSKSEKLISEINYLLYYFGIVGRIYKIRRRCPTTGWRRNQWFIRIMGQDNLKKFAKEINFVSTYNKKRFSKIFVEQGNTNVDFVPGLQPIFKEIYELFSPQLHNWRQFADWKNGKRRPSPKELLKIINIIEEKVQYFKGFGTTFQILSELPSLSTIIDLGTSTEFLDNALQQTLGASWRVMRSHRFEPLSQNAFKAIKVINGNSYSLTEVKEKIHTGFKMLDLPAVHYKRALEPRYVQKVTRYGTIQKSAQLVWQRYCEILEYNIPKVEEKLKQLKVLANSDLFWDPIVKVEKIVNKKDKYVYDLTCENGVFLAGKGGMFVHNSYFCKLEILRYLMMGTRVIVIDPENEYEFLNDAVGGSFFKISLNSEHHLNPFDLPTPREDEKPADVLRSNVINLVGLLRVMLGGLTPQEDAIIDQALTETYASKDITPETDPTTWKDKIPLMSDFEIVLDGMEGTESLLERARKFTKGSYAQFFNNPSNVDMSNPFVVFGLRDMEEELRQMAMFIILRYIWNQVRSTLKKRILLVDEAWWIMQSEDGASFLFGLCKRARKYWLGVTTITQDVSDFMSSSYGRPIITNSSLQFLMKQSPASIDEVQKTFNLTEGEKNMLLGCAVGEGVFLAGQKRVALKVVASYTEDQIITSSPEEVQKIKEAKRQLVAGAAIPPTDPVPEKVLPKKQETVALEDESTKEEAPKVVSFDRERQEPEEAQAPPESPEEQS